MTPRRLKRARRWTLARPHNQRHSLRPTGTTATLDGDASVLNGVNTLDPSTLVLAAVVESSDDAIITRSLDGTIETWNRGAERMFGYTSGEAVGRPISIMVPPEHLEKRTARSNGSVTATPSAISRPSAFPKTATVFRYPSRSRPCSRRRAKSTVSPASCAI